MTAKNTRLYAALRELHAALSEMDTDETASERRLWNDIQFQRTERLHRKYESRRAAREW